MNIPISYKWLASHFDSGVPAPEEVSRLFMLHLCEVEGAEKKGDDTIFDLKILPDRGHDLLSHKGIAHEISVLAGIPMKELPRVNSGTTGITTHLRAQSLDIKKCPRYTARVIQGVKVGESPAWLRERLEAVGQRSINNIVDVTNFVMLELGQPMHAFDMDKLARASDGAIEMVVRPAHSSEPITTLDNKELSLSEETLVVTDNNTALAIAGIKGGKRAEVDANTANIVLEAANFDAVNTRRTSARIGIRTDSSKRFEHGLSESLVDEAMGVASALIQELFPGALLGGVVDTATRAPKNYKVGISARELNTILGTALNEEMIRRLIERLGFSYTVIEKPNAFILEEAQKLVGKPYKYGASVLYDAPSAFDCSSFTAYLYKEAGIQIPRVSIDQLVFGEPVNLHNMEVGDLIFANTGILEKIIYEESVEWMPGTKVPSGVDHVGIYLGEKNVLHASRYGAGTVVVENLFESKQFKNIVAVRRIRVPEEPRFVISIPLERLDLRTKEDLAEEIGRVYGFHNIQSTPLPELQFEPRALKAYYYSNKIRDALVGAGFSEVFTYSFQKDGLFAVANPIAEDKGFLRKDLTTGIRESLAFNARNAPLLGTDNIKVFEIGKVFPGLMQEKLSCAVGVELTKGGKKKDALTHEALELARTALIALLETTIEDSVQNGVFEFDLGALLEKLADISPGEAYKAVTTRYTKLSQYPFVLRDIALWVPEGVTSESVLEVVTREAGELLRVKRLFDVFTKEFPEGKKTSYAYNLVFQSYEKTLSDDEVNALMARVTEALTKLGYTVR